MRPYSGHRAPQPHRLQNVPQPFIQSPTTPSPQALTVIIALYNKDVFTQNNSLQT